MYDKMMMSIYSENIDIASGRLAPMADELVDRIAILVAARRFPSMGVADSRSLRSDNYVTSIVM
jgi:GTP-sensing pleiotropic transcriptional regulator CodY